MLICLTHTSLLTVSPFTSGRMTHLPPAEAHCVDHLRCMQILYALVEQALQSYDVEQFGVAQYLYTTGAFWTTLLACALVSFGHRLLERGYVWLFRPQVCPGTTPSPLRTRLEISPSHSAETARPLQGPPPWLTGQQNGSDQDQMLLASLALQQPGKTRPTDVHIPHPVASGPPAPTRPTPLFWEGPPSCQRVCALSAHKVRPPCQDFMIMAEVEAAEAAQPGPAAAQLGWQTLQRLKALKPTAASRLGRARRRAAPAREAQPQRHLAAPFPAQGLCLCGGQPGRLPAWEGSCACPERDAGF